MMYSRLVQGFVQFVLVISALAFIANPASAELAQYANPEIHKQSRDFPLIWWSDFRKLCFRVGGHYVSHGLYEVCGSQILKNDQTVQQFESVCMGGQVNTFLGIFSSDALIPSISCEM